MSLGDSDGLWQFLANLGAFGQFIVIGFLVFIFWLIATGVVIWLAEISWP